MIHEESYALHLQTIRTKQMKKVIKIVCVSILGATVTQSAEKNDLFGQSIMMDPNHRQIENQLWDHDTHAAIQLSLENEKDEELKDIHEQFEAIAIAESADEEKKRIQIEKDEIFALQFNHGNFDESIYDESILKAIALSLEENYMPKQPIEIKEVEPADIIVNDQLVLNAGHFLSQLREQIIQKYPEFVKISKVLKSEEELLERLLSDSLLSIDQIDMAKINISVYKKQLSDLEEEFEITQNINKEFNSIDLLKALTEKFSISKKNAQEILDTLGM